MGPGPLQRRAAHGAQGQHLSGQKDYQGLRKTAQDYNAQDKEPQRTTKDDKGLQRKDCVRNGLSNPSKPERPEDPPIPTAKVGLLLQGKAANHQHKAGRLELGQALSWGRFVGFSNDPVCLLSGLQTSGLLQKVHLWNEGNNVGALAFIWRSGPYGALLCQQRSHGGSSVCRNSQAYPKWPKCKCGFLQLPCPLKCVKSVLRSRSLKGPKGPKGPNKGPKSPSPPRGPAAGRSAAAGAPG